MRSAALGLGLALTFVVAGSQDAHAAGDLCSSIPYACDYSTFDVPVLAAEVCWYRATATARLKLGTACPAGSWSYSVKYGVVDPFSLVVSAFVPLENACDVPGLCTGVDFAPAGTTSGAMCCIDGTCYPHYYVGGCEGGELFFCEEGVTNEDGTVECFDDTNV